MGCESFRASDANVIICSRGRRRQLCSVGLCGKDSVALCDYPLGGRARGKTCDSPMCERHRHPVPNMVDTDWCEGHWNHEQRQQEQP
jgi:hypothetical protein